MSSSRSGADANGQVTIPNVFKLPKEQAVAALRRAGVQGDITDDDSLCGSSVEGRLIERGEVPMLPWRGSSVCTRSETDGRAPCTLPGAGC